MKSQIANTIAQQLGGSKFIAMTGATFTGGENQLCVALGRSRAVVITLDANDTYTVALHKPGRFTKAGEWKQTAPKIRSGVYCDNLQTIFTELTGLYCSL